MFFITSKILMRFNVVFSKVYSHSLWCFFIFMEDSYPLTASTRPDVHISLIFTWYERAPLGNSLHVRSNFWCLIMTLIKFMQHVYVASLKSNEKKYYILQINHRYFDFLFELPNRKPVTGSYLLPNFSLVSLEKIVLIKKFIAKFINYKSF